MDIESLRECLYLSQSLNFTETARRFYITQSALSRHIAHLESELDTTLFIRSKSGVSLTEAGEVFLTDIEKVLDEYELALKHLNAHKSGFDSTIRLGYLFGASSSFLAEAIASMKQSHPTISIDSQSLEINEMIDALGKDQITMAITTGVWQYPDDIYCERKLYQDGVTLMLPPGHALLEELAGRDSVSIDELRGRADVLAPSMGVGDYETTEFSRQLGLFDSAASSAALKGTADILSVKMKALSSGCGLITYRNVEEFYRDDSLQFIEVECPIEPFYVRAIWKRARENDAILDLADALEKASEWRRL